ncbi:interferon alpha-inducible protein 27-like protein 2B isoform X1 [Heterodontus francisci]|uniref:interferon alpha-inducible protein 27-like protein 2B isoform X1 n=1 Tax=Heterodontus francisci TaxID=7792 RepID=UPI00355C25F5
MRELVYIALILSASFNTGSSLPSCDIDWSTVAWVAGGAAAAVVAAPVVVGAAGFTGAGIAAGSLGAKMMSVAAVANGGGVAVGGVVAILQSIELQNPLNTHEPQERKVTYSELGLRRILEPNEKQDLPTIKLEEL